MGTGPVPQSDALTGVVAALPAEARAARRLESLGWRIMVAGMGRDRAHAACQALLDAGARRLLVWGTAGALHPDLQTGDRIAPAEVMDTHGRRFPVAKAWQTQLLAGLPASGVASTAALVSVERPVADHRAKTALAQQTGAAAVDMESTAVARFASAHGLPFAVLRTIVDPLEQTLPPVVRQTPPGRLLPARLAMRLATRPRDLPALIELARNMRVASRSLGGMARALAHAEGPGAGKLMP